MARRGVLNEYHFSKRKNEGYVYIAYNPKLPNIYKIGRTTNLQTRLCGLKKEYCENLVYYYVSNLLYNNVEAEEMLHEQLIKENTTEYYKGEEWFEIGATHLDAIVEDIKRAEKVSEELFDLEKGEFI